jgi:hypothetical protein
MRRILSISLTLLLWLGPLASLLPGSDESQLPFCCRRHGAHHCGMDAASAQGSSVEVKALSRCAQFPAALGVSTTPAAGLTASAINPLILFIDKYSSGASRNGARAGQIRAAADRGPPSAVVA